MPGHISYPRTAAVASAWSEYRQAVTLANAGAVDAAISKLRAIIEDAEAPAELKELASALLNKLYSQQASALDKAASGHVVERHGPELTDQTLTDRLLKGFVPGGAGQMSNAPPASTKFCSYEALVETQRTAVDRLRRERGIDLTKPPQDGITQYELLIDHGSPIDDGFIGIGSKIKITDASSGKEIKVWSSIQAVFRIQKTYTKIAWNGKQWNVVQHFPKP
jgi:hypothetical protein